VDLDGVKRAAASTGSATILVDAHGENCIAVAYGANALADPEAVPDSMLAPGAVLVLQHEVSAQANAVLIARAHRAGARIVLNAALDARAPLPDALRAAVVAGSLACTAAGAQSALPERDAIAAALRSVTAPMDRRC